MPNVNVSNEVKEVLIINKSRLQIAEKRTVSESEIIKQALIKSKMWIE